MATPKRTRIAIIIIAIMMVAGTIGSFAVIILADKNQATDNQRNEEALAEWQRNQAEYQAKVEVQASELSKRYFDTFNQFADRPASYDKDSITELAKTDLRQGDGAEIDGETKFAAYYLGWNSDGKVFDGSIDGDKLKAPLRIDEGLDRAALIPGWVEGIPGMKIGGVRELALPSDKAYGETGSGDNIPPNMPLKFIIMAIELPEAIPEPEMPEAVLRSMYGL